MSSSLEPLRNFRRNPCSLEHLASVVSAAVLSHRRDSVVFPSVIKRKVDRFIPQVKNQITSWCSFYNREIFFDESRNRAQKYFHVLIWSADGTINGEETAREMLKRDDLNAEEKYRIACNHCLENDIKSLRLDLNTEIDLQKAEQYHPMVYYWERVSARGEGNTAELTKYVMKNVFKLDHRFPICVINYFLYRLSGKKRMSLFQDYYFREIPFAMWEHFLITLSNEQLVSFFGNLQPCYNNYMEDLMLHWMHADFVVQIWIRIRDTYPKYAFCALLRKMLTCKQFPSLSTDHISLSVEIFNLAPYHLKNAAFDEYTRDHEGWWNRDCNLNDIRLDMAILSIVRPDSRAYWFWKNEWTLIYSKYSTNCFEQFMNVCCKEEGGSEKFKTEVIEIHYYDLKLMNYCSTLLIQMRFSELNRFLGLFSSDPGKIREAKQKILREYFLYSTDWFETPGFIFPPPIHFIDFIEESFENIRSANEFKMKVLSTVRFLKVCYMVAGKDLFDWLKETVWMCSCSDHDFKKHKTYLYSSLKESVYGRISGVFKGRGWKSFLSWCLNKEI